MVAPSGETSRARQREKETVCDVSVGAEEVLSVCCCSFRNKVVWQQCV